MAEMVRNYLVIGAHPDDPDLLFGGCAVKLLKAGHQVKFVSVSSGDWGSAGVGEGRRADRI